jgi:GT2 family glycosyltransferase
VIELKKDLGPPYAINLACQKAQGEYILILNNDVILPKDLIEKMVKELEKDKNCALNPVELSFKYEYLSSGGPSVWIGRFLHKIINLKGDRPFFPSTACCLTTKDLILNNPLNEHLFMYEDTEWGWRLQLMRIKLKVIKDGYFLHRGSGSEDTSYSPKQAYFVGRATISTCFICFKMRTLLLILPILFCNYLWQVLVYLKRKKFQSVWAYTKGYLGFFKKLGVFFKDRELTQKTREIKDREVLKLMIASIDFEKDAEADWREKEKEIKFSKELIGLPVEVSS